MRRSTLEAFPVFGGCVSRLVPSVERSRRGLVGWSYATFSEGWSRRMGEAHATAIAIRLWTTRAILRPCSSTRRF